MGLFCTYKKSVLAPKCVRLMKNESKSKYRSGPLSKICKCCYHQRWSNCSTFRNINDPWNTFSEYFLSSLPNVCQNECQSCDLKTRRNFNCSTKVLKECNCQDESVGLPERELWCWDFGDRILYRSKGGLVGQLHRNSGNHYKQSRIHPASDIKVNSSYMKQMVQIIRHR